MFGDFGAAKRKAEDDGKGSKAAKMSNGTEGGRKATFSHNLAALNSQFAAWVAEQSSAAPKELWTDGVEDYLKHAKQLLEDFKDVLEGGGKAGGTAAPAFGAAASKPPLAPGGLFGAGQASGPAAAPASIFGALPAGGGGFGLGGGGGFGGSTPGSAANSGGSGLFNVPSTGTLGSSFNTAATGQDEEGEEGEEEQNAEPSVQVEAGEGTELLAKQRAKLTSMTPEKKWKDKGHGTLTLRRAVGDDAASKRPYFVFTTDSGRILINAPLVKGMKPTSNPKQPAAVILFLISNVDGKEERAMHMFRLENADVAQQLLATINEHV